MTSRITPVEAVPLAAESVTRKTLPQSFPERILLQETSPQQNFSQLDLQQAAALLSPARNLAATRRGLMLAPLLMPLLAALPFTFLSGPAQAIDPNETQVTLPDQFPWKAWTEGPPHSAEIATLYGSLDKPGPYVVAMKWYPGYMSAPHTYVTDRLCFVLSGTWWVNSGDQFRPDTNVPVPAGGFVRRVAHTPHYDGVKSGEKDPAVIGIFGLAPVDIKLVDPSKPPWRAV